MEPPFSAYERSDQFRTSTYEKGQTPSGCQDAIPLQKMDTDMAMKEMQKARMAGRLFPLSFTAARERRKHINDKSEPGLKVSAKGAGILMPRTSPIRDTAMQANASIFFVLSELVF